MLTEKLQLMKNCVNVVSLSQADVDDFKLDEESIQQFKNSVDLVSKRAKNHLSYQYVKFHLDNDFKYLDIVKIPKYPMLAVYNKNTKHCLINISASLKSNVMNIDPRDLYTMTCYAHCCSCLTINQISSHYYEPFCSYMCLMLLKMFAKKYGITGSYVDLIPQFKYIVCVYILIKFFGMNFGEADKKAKAFSKFDSSNLFKRVKVDNYDLGKIDNMLNLMSDSNVCPGINLYKFLEIVIRQFGSVMNLAIFEDLMRFCCTLFCCTINGNSYFMPNFQLAYSQKDYDKIIQIIEKTF